MSEKQPVYWIFRPAGAVIPPAETFLSPAGVTQLSSLRFPRRREERLAGRWAAYGLTHTLAFLQGAEVENEPSGAPYLVRGGQRLAGCLSLSHRAGTSAAAYSPSGSIGIDLEVVEPRSATFLQDFFTREELAWGCNHPHVPPEIWANLIWSAKEACLKAMRIGLRLDTRQIQVHLPQELPPALIFSPLNVSCPQTGGNLSAWWLQRGSMILTLVALRSEQEPALELNEVV